MDPFTLKPYDPPGATIRIGETDFDLPSLYEWVFNRRFYVNPVTNRNFSKEERSRIRAAACHEFALDIYTDMRGDNMAFPYFETSLMDPNMLVYDFTGADQYGLQQLVEICIDKNAQVFIKGFAQPLVFLVHECPTILLKDLGFKGSIEIVWRENQSDLQTLEILLEYRRIAKECEWKISEKVNKRIREVCFKCETVDEFVDYDDCRFRIRMPLKLHMRYVNAIINVLLQISEEDVTFFSEYDPDSKVYEYKTKK